VLSVAGLCALLAPTALADLPNPCQAVPAGVVASALGLQQPPTSTLATVTNASTCSFKGGMLTVSVGYTALTNPAPPLKETKVPGLPNGIYETYRGSTQTQVTFFKGTAASGLYAVIRSFGHIPKLKLEKVAKALYAGLGDASGGGGGGTLVS
jgi:hypothetical protein